MYLNIALLETGILLSGTTEERIKQIIENYSILIFINMTIMGKLLDLIGGGLIEKTDKLLDNLTTSKEEKLELKNKLTELYIEEEKKAQEQVTSRWEADMASDSFLAKNIRPIVLVFLTFIFVLISFFDGNVGDFKIV